MYDHMITIFLSSLSLSTHDASTSLSQAVKQYEFYIWTLQMTYNPSRNEHFTSHPFVICYMLISTIKRIKQ